MSPLSMTVTNPALWAGAAALAAPLIVHLLTRHRARRLVFPTVRFIRQSRAEQSAIYRLRHLILLLLRTLFLLFLLLAFLRPLAHRAAGPPADGTTRVAAVIVLDASASMGYSGPDGTPFARAQVAAASVVESLRPGDVANLVVAAATPLVSFPAPELNRFHLTRDIGNAKLTEERADLDAALAEALQQLGGVKNARKEIHFISDFQRSNWAAVPFARIPAGVETVFVPVAPADARNLAVTDVQLDPASPTRDEPVEITCSVANHAPERRDVTVELTLDGGAPLRRTVALGPGGSGAATFRLSAKSPGRYEGRVTVPGDGLRADDTRCFALPVEDRMQVVVISGDPAAARARQGRHLLRALQPLPEQAQRGLSLRVVPAAAVDKFVLAPAELAIVHGAGVLPEAAGRALLRYMADGGSVVYFLTRDVDRANLDALVQLAAGELALPFEPVGLLDLSRGGAAPYAVLAGANFDSPFLRRFRDSGALGEIRFYRHFQTTRHPGVGEVLLQYDNGHAALALGRHGAGSLLLCNMSPNVEDSELPKSALMVPLMHELVRAMRPRAHGAHAFVTGGPASLTVRLRNPAAPIAFRDPSGAAADASFELQDRDASVVFGVTPRLGFYRVFEGDDRIGSVPVNLDARESAIDYLAADGLRELAQRGAAGIVATAGAGADAFDGFRHGRPLWHWCLLAALLLLAAEQTLALIWKR